MLLTASQDASQEAPSQDRRDLNESQRALVAAKLATLPAHRPGSAPRGALTQDQAGGVRFDRQGVSQDTPTWEQAADRSKASREALTQDEAADRLEGQ
jgi:hypothetical protein